MKQSFNIIAIDGPSGVGKSTIAKQLSSRLSCLYVDTGAMFRCLALQWKEGGCPTEESKLLELGKNTKIQLTQKNQVFCNDNDVSEKIRGEEVSKLASQISVFPVIRDILKEQQRSLVSRAKEQKEFLGSVIEGRDIGTVVFPNANFKFFLVADDQIRAKRRYEQFLAKGQTISFAEVLTALQKRDEQDESRAIAPLEPAEDAIFIDSSQLDIEGVLSTMMKTMQES